MTETPAMRDLFNQKLEASLQAKGVNTVIIGRDYYGVIQAVLEKVQDEQEKSATPLEYSYVKRYALEDVDGEKRIVRRGLNTLLVCKEDLFDIIQEAHLRTGHGGRLMLDKELRRSFYNVTQETISIYLGLCEECQQRNATPGKPRKPGRPRKPMTTLKREMMSQTTQLPNKRIKREKLQDLGGDPVEADSANTMEFNSETQDFEGGDPPVEDDEFREPEDPTYSPFPNHETEEIVFEDNCTSSRTETDTIKLLMKIEKLQTEVRYERRCRMLAERELRELKEMNALMMQMRHTAHELRVAVDHVRHGSDTELPTQSNDESTSCITENATETRLANNHIPEICDGDESYMYLSEGLRVPRILFERISQITDFKKYISALLMILFDRETLATHCMGGRTSVTTDDSHKPQLPADTMRCIIDHVEMKYGVDINLIKIAIRTKLSNEDKLYRKRQQSSLQPNTVPQPCVGVPMMDSAEPPGAGLLESVAMKTRGLEDSTASVASLSRA